jgi:hypothetical protein
MSLQVVLETYDDVSICYCRWREDTYCKKLRNHLEALGERVEHGFLEHLALLFVEDGLGPAIAVDVDDGVLRIR